MNISHHQLCDAIPCLLLFLFKDSATVTDGRDVAALQADSMTCPPEADMTKVNFTFSHRTLNEANLTKEESKHSQKKTS